MKIDGRTEFYGIIGWPVEHTASPALQNAAFAHFGMNAVYAPMAVAPASLERAAAGLRALGFKGFNVTVPHKVRVMEYLDGVEGAAAELKAVNVVVNRGGRLTGHNTDAEGFRMSLGHEGVEVKGGVVAVLGAGGAARAVVRALQQAGAAKIFLINRTFEKAVGISEAPQYLDGMVRPVRFSDPRVDNIFSECSIIVNATTLGLRKTDPPPLDPGKIRPGHTLVDLIYQPRTTAFLEAGAAKGARTVNGYGMLVFQAMEAFRLWTGERPPVEVMWNAGMEGLK